MEKGLIDAILENDEKLANSLRAQLRQDKKSTITATMKLSADENRKFAPVYDAYEKERTQLFDRQIGLVKKYAEDFEGMTEAKVKELVRESFEIDRAAIALREKYVGKLQQELSAIAAARFNQLVNRFEMFIAANLSEEIPFVTKPADL